MAVHDIPVERRTLHGHFSRELDTGHPLIGPFVIRGAEPGAVLEVRIDEVRPGSYGFTTAGGWSSALNDRLGLAEGETKALVWEIDAARAVARDQRGREVALAPF